jgi:hypothetical protein
VEIGEESGVVEVFSGRIEVADVVVCLNSSGDLGESTGGNGRCWTRRRRRETRESGLTLLWRERESRILEMRGDVGGGAGGGISTGWVVVGLLRSSDETVAWSCKSRWRGERRQYTSRQRVGGICRSLLMLNAVMLTVDARGGRQRRKTSNRKRLSWKRRKCLRNGGEPRIRDVRPCCNGVGLLGGRRERGERIGRGGGRGGRRDGGRKGREVVMTGLLDAERICLPRKRRREGRQVILGRRGGRRTEIAVAAVDGASDLRARFC